MRITKWHLVGTIILSMSFVVGAVLLSRWHYSQYDVEQRPDLAAYKPLPPVSTATPDDINFDSGVIRQHVRSFDDINQTSITHVGHNVAMTTDGMFFDNDGYEITDGLTLFQTMMGTTEDPRQSLINTHNKWGYDGQKAAQILDAFFASLTYDELIAFSKMEPKAMMLFRHARGYVLPGDPQVE